MGGISYDPSKSSREDLLAHYSDLKAKLLGGDIREAASDQLHSSIEPAKDTGVRVPSKEEIAQKWQLFFQNWNRLGKEPSFAATPTMILHPDDPELLSKALDAAQVAAGFAASAPSKGAANPQVPYRAGAAEGRPRTEAYGPELAPKIVGGEVKSVESTAAAVRKTLTDWAAGHPDNAAVAAALYDEQGNVTLKVHLAGGNQDLVGQWEIGRVQVPNAKYGTKPFGDRIEPLVRKLVGEVTGQRFEEKSSSATGSDFAPRLPQWQFNLLRKR